MPLAPIVVAAAVFMALLNASQASFSLFYSPIASPTATSTNTATGTSTSTPTPTATNIATATSTPTATSTATPAPTFANKIYLPVTARGYDGGW
ncbi:MAG: hypothetical protein Q7O66_20810 [Dehalococcoidia bacterium]|nr:hypothetical protein [Dehalococcoidia bacterium]